jgi:NAD+ kinase
MEKFFVVTEDNAILKKYPFGLLTESAKIVQEPKDATAILVISGDGGMLAAVHKYLFFMTPFIGLNIGHAGFLMNELRRRTIEEIAKNQTVSIFVRMLQADIFDGSGKVFKSAFNDFYFERASSQTANIKVTIDGKVRFPRLICDGVLVCSQAGSTAYNAAAGGVILPIETDAMVLTGICPAIFHRWRSTILSDDSTVVLEPVDTEKRPVRFLCDGKEIPGVTKAVITYSDSSVELKFAKSQHFREKVLQLQF